jgi:hypothetical protein
MLWMVTGEEKVGALRAPARETSHPVRPSEAGGDSLLLAARVAAPDA